MPSLAAPARASIDAAVTRSPLTSLLTALLVVFALALLPACGSDDVAADGGKSDKTRTDGQPDAAGDGPRDGLGDGARREAAPDDTVRLDTTRDGPPRDGPKPDGPKRDTVPADTLPPQPDTIGSIPGTWVTIPAGTFTMGSPASQNCRDSAESQHQVTLTRPFEIMTTEATQAMFLDMVGYNPSFFDKCGMDCPAESINWHEAVAFCNALSKRKGLAACYSCTGGTSNVACQEATAYTGKNVYACPGYRLPTEAEWEYAYRAGTTTTFYSGNNNQSICYTCGTLDPNADKIGWYCANTAVTYAGCDDMTGNGGPACGGPHPVGKKQPNAWGLYDMSGNLWEWMHDRWQHDIGTAAVTDPVVTGAGTDRDLRGGSWFLDADLLRGAYRKHLGDTTVDYNLGVRCVRTK